MFKKYNFKIFRCNPNDPKFGLFKFAGKINLHISKLREKKNKIKTANEVINKLPKTSKKQLQWQNQKNYNDMPKEILSNYKK